MSAIRSLLVSTRPSAHEEGTRRHEQAVDRLAALQVRDDRVRADADEAGRCQRHLHIGCAVAESGGSQPVG
jgi:hypothetical protein